MRADHPLPRPDRVPGRVPGGGPGKAPGAPRGGLLTWLAGFVGLGAVVVLVVVATLLVHSARSRGAVEEAGRHLPAPGRYDVSAERPASARTADLADGWRLTVTGAEVGASDVRVLLTWTNTAAQARRWACPGPVTLSDWQDASIAVPGAGAAATGSRCGQDAPTAQDVAPGATVADWRTFPRDAAWGAGATRLTAQDPTDADATGVYGSAEREPAVRLVVDLGEAVVSAP